METPFNKARKSEQTEEKQEEYYTPGVPNEEGMVMAEAGKPIEEQITDTPEAQEQYYAGMGINLQHLQDAIQSINNEVAHTPPKDEIEAVNLHTKYFRKEEMALMLVRERMERLAAMEQLQMLQGIMVSAAQSAKHQQQQEQKNKPRIFTLGDK